MDADAAAVAGQAPGRFSFDSHGLDAVAFLVSANPGEPLKPLAKVASGGETSRLMLALKTVLGRADETPTLIFDEIDQGIGGRVGGTVGRKLWGLTGRDEEREEREQETGSKGSEQLPLLVFQLPASPPPGTLHHPPAAVGGVWRFALSRGEAHYWRAHGD